MNAQKCRILTSTFMHSYSMAHCVYYCACSISGASIELHTLHLNRVLVPLTTVTYPAPKQGSGTVLFRVSDLRVGGKAPGYATI